MVARRGPRLRLRSRVAVHRAVQRKPRGRVRGSTRGRGGGLGAGGFVFRAALFFVGLIAGGVIGAKLFGLLQGNDHNVLLGVIFVVAVAFISGIATQRFHNTVLTAVCALGGAGLALSGVARAFPETLGFLRTPTSTAETILATIVWLVLAILGWLVQRRLVGHERMHSG